jgi:23S rRNA A2030 N6-methylase RlmJ
MSIWYPLENRLDQIHEANKKLKDFGFNIVEVDLDTKADDVSTAMDQ